MRTLVIAALAFLTAACQRAPETAEQCAARLLRIAEAMPHSSGSVSAVYTFDLSRSDRDLINQLTVSGIDRRGRPRMMVADQATSAARAAFDKAPPGRTGVIYLAPSTALLKIPHDTHASAEAAVQEGCRMLPGARLQAVALTAA